MQQKSGHLCSAESVTLIFSSPSSKVFQEADSFQASSPLLHTSYLYPILPRDTSTRILMQGKEYLEKPLLVFDCFPWKLQHFLPSYLKYPQSFYLFLGLRRPSLLSALLSIDTVILCEIISFYCWSILNVHWGFNHSIWQCIPLFFTVQKEQAAMK